MNTQSLDIYTVIKNYVQSADFKLQEKNKYKFESEEH